MNICLILINKYSEFTTTTDTRLAITERYAPNGKCYEVVKTVMPDILTHVSIIITCISCYIIKYNIICGVHKLEL